MYTSSYVPSFITSYFTGYVEPKGVKEWNDDEIAVTLREAQEGEMPPRVYRVICSTMEVFSKITNTIYMVRYRDLGRLARTLPDHDPFVHRAPNYLHPFTLTARLPLMNAIFKEYRRSEEGLFSHQGQHPIVLVVKKLLPEVPNALPYILLTADEKEVKTLRALIHEHLKASTIQDRENEIRSLVQARIQTWKDQIDLKQEVELLAAEVFTKLFLGFEGPYEEVVHFVRDIFELIGKLPLRQPISEGEWQQARTTFSSLCERILEHPAQHSMVATMEEQGYDLGAMKCMLFNLLLGGHETTASVITYTLLRCAQDPQLQEDIQEHPEHIENLIAETLRLSPPAIAAGRTASKNLILEITNRTTNEIAKRFIPKGQNISPWMWKAARQPQHFQHPEQLRLERWEGQSFSPLTLPYKPFGGGVHACPGAPLAWKEAQVVIEEVLQSYKLSTPIKGEPTFKHSFITWIDQRLPVSIQDR